MTEVVQTIRIMEGEKVTVSLVYEGEDVIASTCNFCPATQDEIDHPELYEYFIGEPLGE